MQFSTSTSLNLRDFAKQKDTDKPAGMAFNNPLEMNGVEPTQEQIDFQVAKIKSKLKNGKKLSPKEMDFLKQYAPDLYESAKKAERAREQVEEQLKHCQSKEEAQNIIHSALESVSQKDPDYEIKTAAIEDAAQTFQESKSYKTLPETIKEAQEKKQKSANSEDYEAPGCIGLYKKSGDFYPFSEQTDSSI